MQSNDTVLAESERKRVRGVVGTLAGMTHQCGTLREVAHDARNMVTALALYCDLLAEPGVLNPEYLRYADELRLVTAASRRLVEKLAIIDYGLSRENRRPDRSPAEGTAPGTSNFLAERKSEINSIPGYTISNLQQELLGNQNLLDATSGLGIALALRTEGGARGVRLTGEDLTRVLLNLVKNATEAMRGSGTIKVTLSELPGKEGGVTALLLSVEDNGPGIPPDAIEKVFETGYTTRAQDRDLHEAWPVVHRGLGLSITRSIVEAAGGSIRASNLSTGGARLEIKLPVTAAALEQQL